MKGWPIRWYVTSDWLVLRLSLIVTEGLTNSVIYNLRMTCYEILVSSDWRVDRFDDMCLNFIQAIRSEGLTDSMICNLRLWRVDWFSDLQPKNYLLWNFGWLWLNGWSIQLFIMESQKNGSRCGDHNFWFHYWIFLSFKYVFGGRNVPKFDGHIWEPSSYSIVMSLHVRVYTKMNHVLFLTLEWPVMIF